ncbi:DUF933 domain-containing protein [Klebsiella pneumoniae subsp. pneumoniae]|nr:DUF933 domain-containing protein [Klebsiella pneumoniae subsp. pneumoniae]
MKEVRAWTIPVERPRRRQPVRSTPTSEKGFIRAQTIAYEDFIAYKGEQGAERSR